MVRLVALGGLALLGDDGPVSGAAGRGRNLALVALLDRAGEAGMSRDRLAAHLWPESDRARARHSLDQALYTLRKALGADAFVAVAEGLALDPDVVQSDAAAFERAVDAGDARRAIEVYGGPFLDGFHLSDAGDFERWVDGERALLERRYAGALEEVARSAGDAGDPGTAIEHWRRLAALSPLSSRVTVELMRALERGGDGVKALQAARVHEALVREELGTGPDPSVLEYVDELERAAGAVSRPEAMDVPEGADKPTRHRVASPGSDRPVPVSSGAAPPPDRSRRVPAWLVFGLGSFLVLSVGLLSTRGAPATGSPPRVGVTAFENQTGEPTLDALGPMAADWIVEGLARTGLVRAMRYEGGIDDAANVVEGRLYRAGDSVWLQANVRGADGAVIRSLQPVAAPAAAPGRALEPLRRQVLGAMGTLYDPRMEAWAESTLRPPSFEAYQAFAAGMDRYSARDLSGMAEQFRSAVRLDADYLTAQLWLAWTASLMNDHATADSIARALRTERDRMSPLERAWHDRQLALFAGDSQRSYDAAVRMRQIAPSSGWIIASADAALTLGRPVEAIAALEEAGLEALGPTRDHGASLLTAALHAAGDYRRELEVTEQTVRAMGLDWDFVGPGVRALAALGRVDALEERFEQLRMLPPSLYGTPRGAVALMAAAMELRTHGHADEAVALVDRALALDDAWDGGRSSGGMPSPDEGDALWWRVGVLYEMGRWTAAERVLAAVPAGAEDFDHRAMTALLAARSGDTATARAVDGELAAIERPYLFGEPTVWRARIAAALGEDDRAMRLVRLALSEGQGSRFRWILHTHRDFERLREQQVFRGLYGVGSR